MSCLVELSMKKCLIILDSGHEDIDLFMLNSTEHVIYHAHKNNCWYINTYKHDNTYEWLRARTIFFSAFSLNSMLS